jgi:prepilin-type N-terminal cleavage/methylation domain-containing protein
MRSWELRRDRGFTLAELAVAVAIIALLLFGAMVPFSTQMDIRNVAETQRSMDSMREAILGFASANGRLPCPANGATPAGGVDTTTWPTAVVAGAEQWDPANNRCYTAFGVVPWTTLGTPETDAWGRRLTYRVTPAFADAISLNTWQSRQTPVPGTFPSQTTPAIASPADQGPTCPNSNAPAVAPFVLTPSPALSSFALCTLGDIAVFTRTISAAVPLATALPAVFISHGKNGYGAWQPSGIRITAPAAGTDEAANVNGNTTATPAVTGGYLSWAYYSRNQTSATSGCADPVPPGTSASPLCEFDDIVTMISLNTLIARMVAAGKLP